MNKPMMVALRVALVVMTLLLSVAPGPWSMQVNSQEIGNATAGQQLAER